jgi:hypothetical protein
VSPGAAARRQRIKEVRVTVAWISLAAFIALFAAIYVQMASGHDPVLSKRSAAVRAPNTVVPPATPAPPSTAAPAATATPAPRVRHRRHRRPAAASVPSAPAPVTTGQS